MTEADLYFPMRRVVVETPYAALDDDEVAKHESYARRCMLDCLLRGEAPLFSHLLYTQVLNDRDQSQRLIGISAGLSWGPVADAWVVYEDLGISKGMETGIEMARKMGKSIEYRTLGQDDPGD